MVGMAVARAGCAQRRLSKSGHVAHDPRRAERAVAFGGLVALEAREAAAAEAVHRRAASADDLLTDVAAAHVGEPEGPPVRVDHIAGRAVGADGDLRARRRETLHQRRRLRAAAVAALLRLGRRDPQDPERDVVAGDRHVDGVAVDDPRQRARPAAVETAAGGAACVSGDAARGGTGE